MKNFKQVVDFLETKQEQDLMMVDIIVHGSENQIDKIRWEFGTSDSYTEASNLFKNKKMLVTPFILSENNSSDIEYVMGQVKRFASDIGGTKTTELELWTYTDLGDDNIDYDKIRIRK